MSASPLPTVERILFPTDFSSCAEGAYRHAAYLADRFNAELHVLHVVEDEASPERDWPETPGTGALRITLADVCADLGLPAPEPDLDYDLLELIPVTETEVVGRNAPDAILDYVHDEAIGLVVLGTHGRKGWQRGVIGSVAEAVTRRAPCPVLTVRPLDAPGAGEWPPRRIVAAVDSVPYDDFQASPMPAPPSVRWAARLAAAYRAPLELVHVTSPVVLTLAGPDTSAHTRSRAREGLLSMAESLDVPHEVHITVRTGDPADAIRAVADVSAAHLLVVGSHGRQGIKRLVLGSVAESLIRTAPCPVLVVPQDLDVPVPGEASFDEAEVAS